MEPQKIPRKKSKMFRASEPRRVHGMCCRAASGCAASDQPTHHGRGSGECGATGQGSEWESAGSTKIVAKIGEVSSWKIPTSWDLCGVYHGYIMLYKVIYGL